MVEISFSKKYAKNYKKFMKKSLFMLQFPDFLERTSTKMTLPALDIDVVGVDGGVKEGMDSIELYF